MSAAGGAAGWPQARADREHVEDDEGLLSRFEPEEGWLSVALVCLLAGIVGWSIADARWILGRDGYTSFLIWVGALGALWGFVSSRLPIGRWQAHLLGAVIGSVFVIEIVGSLVQGSGGDLVSWFGAASNSVAQAYLDLTWRHLLTTTQFGHFSLILGAVVWVTAQTASYDIFGHHRPVNGVLLLTVALIVNMSMTLQDQFAALVLFSAAALGVLVRTHAVEERTAWLRHRIWRANETHSPNLQGGATFAGIAIIGALVLTTVASSAPLAEAWTGMSDQFTSVGQQIAGWLPQNQGGRFTTPADFSDVARVGQLWTPDNKPVFSAQMPDTTSYHWRVVAYDQFTGNAWTLTPDATASADVPAGQALLAGTQESDAGQKGSRTTKTFRITVLDRTLKQVPIPYQPVSVSVPVTRTTMDAAKSGAGFLSGFKLAGTASTYSVTASVVAADPQGSGLTENKLRATAGLPYPAALKAAFTQGTDRVGPAGRALLKTILAPLGASPTQYDIAKAIQSYLQDGRNFHYQTDITNVACGSLSVVDCFATYKVGFCMQYASTMTMLLRLEGIPARFVEGYLPGSLNQAVQETVSRTQQHAWVEAYFPSFGWVEFDPTGTVGVPTVLPAGPRETIAPGFSLPIDQGNDQIPGRRKPDPATGTTTAANGGLPLNLILALALLALIAVAGLVLVLRRRMPRIEPPEIVYRGLVAFAGRLGYRQQPTQTVYEYVGMLGEAVPRARPQLEVVANATVETVYGHRQLSSGRLRALAEASAKLRTTLLRLLFRRETWRRRRRRR